MAILPQNNQKLTQMKNHIDLGAETVEFVRTRIEEVLGENPQNISRVELNMKEVKEQIFRLLYDSQVCRGWPHVAERTADVLGMSRTHIYELLKK